MPIEIIDDPKTGEKRRVYVSTGGMGTAAPPKPRPQPQPPAGGGFMGTLNDFNPMKQIGALGTGVSTFLQTGDLNKSIAAASREAAPTTGLGRSVDRTLAIGGQGAVDIARTEIDRARLHREQVAAGTSPLDVRVPSTGPGAPSAQRVRLPGWANYDDIRVEPANPVEAGAGKLLALAPYFIVAKGGVGRLTRMLPGVSRLAAGFDKRVAALEAGNRLQRFKGIFAKEAVEGAVPGAIATYYGADLDEPTMSDGLGLREAVKGSPWEDIVTKGLLTDPSDTVEQARIKKSIDDLIWSVPLGGGLGTGAAGLNALKRAGFRGIGAMQSATKRAFADVIQNVIKVGQADQAVKDAATAPAAATVDPSVPSAGTPAPAPAPRVVSGKPTFSSQVYQGLRRQPLWEQTGVRIQGRLEPQAPQSLPVESYTPKLNYSDVNPAAGPLNASGKRYAQALAGQDQIAIEATSQKLRASFNNAAAKLGIELGPNANSQSWSMWDIGKQLYMDANPAKSNKPYVLGNPLTNIQVQADIVDRALGFEITKGVDVEGKRYKSWQLTEIGRKAREEAGVELGLVPDLDAQRTVPAPAAPPTPEAAAAALQQAQTELVAATQRLQSEAAKEVVTAPEVAAVPQGQLPGMNQPAYEQVATVETGSVAYAPKVFQYKAEGQTATGRSGSLAGENVYDPRYGGVISVWRDAQGELGAPGQIYVVNGHNRLELANRSGFPVINVQYIDAPTAADARMTGALQNIKDNKGTAIDAGKLLRDTGMSVEDLRLQNVNLNGKLASEGVALSRIPQWLFDKTATGDLPTAKAVALGSAEGVDDAIISDVAKQAIAGKWSAEKIAQAMQEAKFASTGTGGGDAGPVLPGFEEMFKTTNVVNLIDIRTAAFNKLSVEMRALAAASQSKNTPYLESAGNTINVEGSQAARKMAAEAVAVFNRVTAYEGPVRDLLNELAAQLPEGANRSKAAANLVQFNLQRLRDAISEEMNGPRLIQDEAIVRQIEEPAAAAATTETPATGYADPLEAENLADARSFLGLPATANVAQVARVAKQEGYDGIVFTGDFGLPAGKREIDLRSLPDVKAPENAGNPVPIQAKPVDVAAAPAERPLVKPGAELSHGTSETARKSILAEGFRASEYERSGTVAGEGVYMTPSERYAGEYGSKRVGGALPEDAKILNWTGSDQTLASLADEIGIAGPRELNKSANEVELNQAQQQQLKQWALDNGYDGIQYRTNFTPGGKAQEVVIYNIGLANRIVGSRAAAAPTGAITPGFTAKDRAAAKAGGTKDENEAISAALERLGLAEEAGNTGLAASLRGWLSRRGVNVQGEQAYAGSAFVPDAPAEPPTLTLPRELAGLKPRYSYGQKRFELTFETDLDRVAYTLAGDATGKPSKSHQKYRDWLESNGLDPAEIASYGARVVKPSIKEMAATAGPGTLQVRNQGFGGADFQAELPNLEGWRNVETGAGGTVGEGYTGASRITEREANELARIAFNISGVTDFEVVKRIEEVYGPVQAEAYGDMSLVGQSADLAGLYGPGPLFGGNMADDQIRVAMSAYGVTKSFTQMLSTTYHESFHRLQRWFLTAAEQGVLARSEKAIRELAALNAESLGNPRNAARFRDGTINLKEATAEAFAGFARGLQLPEKVGGIFTKIKELVDQSINFLLSGGKYKTWDDVFEKAALGDMKGRNGEGAVDDGVQFAADPPDPAEFARRIDQNMQALESGDLTPEEITQMGASDVRRLTSRSGQTQYVPEPPDVLIASNKALGEMLSSRAQQTGIGSYSQPAIVKAAMDQLDADGWAVESTTTRLEAARRGDPRSQQDLVALAANLIHRDHIAAQNGMTAIEWQSTVDEADRAVSMQRLWSGLEDQHKLDTALMTASRKDGQRLSVMQIKYDFDPTHRQVPAGTMLYHGTSQEAAEAIIKDGFQAGSLRSNLLGRGVYFAESSMYAGAYGEVAAAGDLPSDVRILDLVSMDKRIADLVQELNLGALEKFEGGLYMTSAQKTAVQDWATGQGYSGIRFSPDFELAGGFTAPETVIFDVNVANRIVGSQAAVEPEIPVSSESMGTDIEAEIGNPMNTILGKIDPDIRSDIERGVMSPGATKMTEVAAQVAISSRSVPGMRAKLNSIVGKIEPGRLNQEMLLQAYRAALLWSPKTWTKMLVGSAYRAVTMPINQAIAETGAAGIAALKGDNKAAYRAMRQAGLDMRMYGKYVSNWSNAFRLVGESFRAGESFGNLGASSMDISQRGLKQYEQTSLFGETNDPANTLDNPWWIDPENMNIPALFAHWGWKALSVSGRVSGSIDTFFSSLIGPSAEWSRVMGLELEKAEGRGLTGDQAWAEASKITDARIENQWVKVILNDRMVKGGAFTGIHAKAAMDWINFTDPLDVQFQPKSYEYGIAKAKEEGITNTAEINKRALAWMQEEPGIWPQRLMGVGQAVGWMPKAFKDAISHTPVLGILNPFPTSPANITKAAMRATGVGGLFVDTFYRDVFSEDRNTRARAIGEIATAYMTLVGGVMLATSGFVEFSGPGTYNPQTRAKMQRLGSQSYSIRFKNPATGDTTRWWDLQALDTVSNVFSLIGLQMSLNNSLPKEDREVLASNFVLSVAETARQVGFAQFTKDMYKSMGEIFNLVSELQDKSFVPTEGQVDPFSGYVQRRLAGFMPAIFNNTRKGSDSYQRAIEKSELPQPFAFAHELAQRFAAKIPGLSDQMPPILHPLTGEPAAIEQAWGVNYLPQDQPWLKGAVNAMSPLAFTPTKEGSKDPVDLELGRLSGRGTAFQIWGPNELGIPNFRMNQTQLNKLAVITSQFIPPGRGSTLHQGLSAMLAPGSSYWQLPPPEASKATQSARVIRINKEINYYKPFIKAEFLASEPELARMIEENKAEQTQATFDATYGMQSSWSPTPR
jgi:hypothetical protein